MVFSTNCYDRTLVSTRCFCDDILKQECVESCSIVSVTDSTLSFEQQLECLMEAVHALQEQGMSTVFMRIFLSDPANQTESLAQYMDQKYPVSIVGQAPLNGTKIAAWVWHRKDAVVSRLGDGLHKVEWRGATEIWSTSALSNANGAYNQTVELLDNLNKALQAGSMSLSNDCIRTWFFVQNIDTNYKGVVDGRNDVFDQHNLTPYTHFIASTGIEGRSSNPQNIVMLDAMGIKGVDVKVSHLYGETHLNRTSEYGVRFERGTVVLYSSVKHVFISGTASIDNMGNILYEANIGLQTLRMLENVEVLLAEAGCGFEDVAAATVYLRDPADYCVVNSIIGNRFPELPYVIVLAPVCRPGWLIEMECVAVAKV